MPLRNFDDFWKKRHNDILVIRDGGVEFRHNQLPRVADYLRMLQEQENLIDTVCAGVQFELSAAFPTDLRITALPECKGIGAAKKTEDLEYLRANTSNFVGPSNRYISERGLEDFDSEGDTTPGRSKQNRRGTPHSGSEENHSDKENLRSSVRLRKRRLRMPDSDQNIKRRRIF